MSDFGKGINVPSKDIVYRQDAIDALNEYFARIGKLKRRGLTKGEKAISLDTVGAIKTLPSAQPEQPTEVQDILQYLDEYLHPIVSPEHWSVYSELHDMVSMLSSAQPDFDMTEKIDKAHDDGYEQGYLQGKTDYERKTGKWVNEHWDGDSNFRIDGRGNCWFVRECSNCHEEIEGKPTKYCPNCGCRMLKEGE